MEASSVSVNGVSYSADAVVGEISMPPFMYASFTTGRADAIHWLRVNGDSMESTLNGGDWVAINTRDTSIGQGGVFAFRDDNGDILIKRLRRVRGSIPLMIAVISDNPKEKTDQARADQITIIGRIVARISGIG